MVTGAAAVAAAATAALAKLNGKIILRIIKMLRHNSCSEGTPENSRDLVVGTGKQ